MRLQVFLWLCSGLALSGCVTAQTANVDADCRHVLTSDGTPLRFCETGAQITVDGSLPQAPTNAGSRLIDNPEFLAQMIEKMPRIPKPVTSSSIGPKICSGDSPGYITIKTGDFLKMVAIHPAMSRSDHAFHIEGGDALPPVGGN